MKDGEHNEVSIAQSGPADACGHIGGTFLSAGIHASGIGWSARQKKPQNNGDDGEKPCAAGRHRSKSPVEKLCPNDWAGDGSNLAGHGEPRKKSDAGWALRCGYAMNFRRGDEGVETR